MRVPLHLDDLGIAAFVGVSNERTKIDLADHLLRPLSGQPELLETLHVFFQENCSPTPTAESLSIHRNTLTYRLNRITALTGLDPRKFDDAVADTHRPPTTLLVRDGPCPPDEAR